MTAGVHDDSVDEAVASTPQGADRQVVAADTPVITASGPATASGAAERPRAPITVEQAYLAKLRAAGEAPSGSAGPGPEPTAAPASFEPPVSRRGSAAGLDVVRRSPVAPAPPPHLRARPRIEPEQGILGLSRHTRSRLGSRLFNLFFVCVFALILVQMVVALLTP